jgi:hypothetical protein
VGGVTWVPELLDHNTQEWQHLASEVQRQVRVSPAVSASVEMCEWGFSCIILLLSGHAGVPTMCWPKHVAPTVLRSEFTVTVWRNHTAIWALDRSCKVGLEK